MWPFFIFAALQDVIRELAGMCRVCVSLSRSMRERSIADLREAWEAMGDGLGNGSKRISELGELSEFLRHKLIFCSTKCEIGLWD